jgi:hypothetical protein
MATEKRAREGSRLIAALEQAWTAIQERHPDVPHVVMITGTGRQGRSKKALSRMTLGHHSPDRWAWAEETGRAPELFVAGEHIADGARAVMETLLHEAAHALAHARGIKDTSSQGNRWHNKRYAALAAELGLKPPERAHKSQGFSDCLITEETAAAYRQVIRRLDTASLPFLADPQAQSGDQEEGDGAKDGGKTGGRREAAECACEPPRRLQITKKILRDGPVVCGLCMTAFAVRSQAGPGEDEDQAEDAAEPVLESGGAG